MLAQRFPNDFDGILGFCPAINWDKFQWSPLWAHRVMDEKGVYPRPCEFEAITAAAMKACDGLDGVEDEIISMPSRCFFDASTLVGHASDCGGKDALFTPEAAEAANAAWNGPRSLTGEFQWYGYERDAKMWQFGALHTSCDGEGEKCAPVRLSIAEAYARYFVAKNADLDLQALGHSQWGDLFVASRNEYESITGTSDPDLSRFRKAGGKLLSWHGMADQIIPVNGTVDYTDKVLKKDPKAHDYFRMFLAPGADHSISNGLTPRNTLSALVEWVEKGIAPVTLRVEGLNAYGKPMTRDICMYPQVQHYVGGDPAWPSSFACV
ncbi:Tannase/feruloyl esterase [Colletotrichum lupini]|nr:Tannase/feruloyl esterase [Colletotrichum lupini]